MKKALKYTPEQINEIVGGILNQIEDGIEINKILPPSLCDETSLALAFSEEEISNLENTKAKIAMVPFGASIEEISTIEVERPKLAMMKLIHLFYSPPDSYVGIHPSAVIDESAKLGKDVSIGPNVVVGRNVEIGDNTKLLANVYVGKDVKIGNDCLFHPGVNIGDFVQIGNRVILQHGASIGADGFSFVTENPSAVESAKSEGNVQGDFSQQKIHKIPSIGTVEIKDDVEVGANACIDRGTIENTIIGRSTKIDNLVMISHNCKIGENCMIISQVGIAGSTVIGDRTVLAGQVGVVDHVTIGQDVIVTAKAGVTKSLPDKGIFMGYPAIPRKEFIRQLKFIHEAEKMYKEIKELKKQVEELTNAQEF